MKRRLVQKANGQRMLVNLWFPSELVDMVDSVAADLDTDRSKFIRAAVREKIARVKAEESR